MTKNQKIKIWTFEVFKRFKPKKPRLSVNPALQHRFTARVYK